MSKLQNWIAWISTKFPGNSLHTCKVLCRKWHVQRLQWKVREFPDFDRFQVGYVKRSALMLAGSLLWKLRFHIQRSSGKPIFTFTSASKCWSQRTSFQPRPVKSPNAFHYWIPSVCSVSCVKIINSQAIDFWKGREPLELISWFCYFSM